MEHIFIINPVAGKGKDYQSLQKQIHAVMAGLALPYKIYMTKGSGDAIVYVHQYCQLNKNVRFYACGGDGTLNEVVNGAVGHSHVSVTAFPCGTGNDFIKNFKTKTNFLDIQALVQAQNRPIDLLKINNRFAINICNVGFDADVAYNMKRFKRLPFVYGSTAYTLAIFYCFFKKLHYHFQIEIGDQIFHDDYLLSIIANGSFYGGGYHGAPLAKIDDGYMDFVGVSKLHRIKILELLKLYKLGLHLEAPQLKKIVSFQRCQRFVLKSKVPVPVCIDGDIWMENEIIAELLPKVIDFAVPE